jgi:hypothetical protein
MKRFSLPTLFILLAACATLGPPITQTNNQIRMSHYSFAVPPDQGWHLSSLDLQAESAIIRKEMPPFIFQISMMRNTILDQKMKNVSAKEVADDFRFREEWGMKMVGVSKGMYSLRNVVRGEEVIENKRYYTMTYTTFTRDVKDLEQRAGMYLYFPKEKDNDWFLVAHFSEAGPPAEIADKSLKGEFLKVLESVSVSHE